MIKIIGRNIVRFVILIALQVWVFNNIQFSGYINPYLYVLFIILLPFETPKAGVLILGFLMGLSVDMFTDTIGMHASASLFVAFIRPYLLQSISPRDGYEPGTFPRVYFYGFLWFLKYTVILVAIHHLALFTVESFSLTNYHLVLWRTLASTTFTTILIMISQFIIFRK